MQIILKILGWPIAIIGLIGLIASIFTLNIIGAIVFFIVTGIGGAMVNKATSMKINKVLKIFKKIEVATAEEIASKMKISKDDKEKLYEKLFDLVEEGKLKELELGNGDTAFAKREFIIEKSKSLRQKVLSEGKVDLEDLAIEAKLKDDIAEAILDTSSNRLDYTSYRFSNGRTVYVSNDYRKKIKDQVSNEIERALSKMGAGDKNQIRMATNLSDFEYAFLDEALEYLRLNGLVEVVEFPEQPPLYKVSSGEGNFTNIATQTMEIQLD